MQKEMRSKTFPGLAKVMAEQWVKLYDKRQSAFMSTQEVHGIF